MGLARQSDTLIAWLRQTLEQKRINTARLGELTGLTRPRLRQILAAEAAMTVDELIVIGRALELTPADLIGADVDPMPVATHGGEIQSIHDEPFTLNPWGNQPQQLFEIAFALGCDFFFQADTTLLGDSGVPKTVLSSHQERPMKIKLEAAFHSYNNPRYSDAGVTLSLSFDAVYDCTFPWAAIQQVVFIPVKPELTADEPTEEPPPPPISGPRRGHLRLVT